MKIPALSFLVIINLFASAQDLHYTRTTIDLLTGEDMHGRGYVKDGHKKAANFIASEFQEFGLQSFSLNYQQQFPLQVNTFPGQMMIKVDDQKLIPAADYLVDPSSPSIRGTYEVINITLDTLLKNTSEWVKVIKRTDKVISLNKSGYFELSDGDRLVVDGLEEVLRFNRELSIPAIVVLDNGKLTWGTSQIVASRPAFHIRIKALKSPYIDRIKFKVRNEHLSDFTSQNVLGLLNGQRTDSLILVTAHYDHLGSMGKGTHFPGANDNASGVAMMLNLARHFSFFQNPKYSLLFIAFGGEEAGLVGSQYYVNRPVYPLSKVKFLINLDIVGTGDEGITVVNGKVYQEEFRRLIEINEKRQLLTEIKSRGQACNSDHCSFDQHQVPGFFIYTLGGIQAYHDIHDRLETLPLTEFENLFRLLRDFIQQ